MCSLASFRASPFSDAISSTTGETMWHGTHHSAQKSTSTGVSESRTFAWNSASFTLPMLSICRRSFRGEPALGSARASPWLQPLGAAGDSRSPGVRLLFQEPLGVDRCLASLPGGGHRLPVDRVGDVPGCEHPGHVRRGPWFVHLD